jgi:conjugative transposon TraM protein
MLQVEKQDENSFEAVIHDTQELVAGATVKMRLLNDIYINGNHIPRNQFVFGVCSINGERLTIEVGSIRTGNSLLPISLTVYDMDGLEGIYIPGAITRDAAKQASDDAMQNIQLMSLDPSIGAQAASAGIEATKGLLSKKAKLVKVTVKSGYRILLKDTKFE